MTTAGPRFNAQDSQLIADLHRIAKKSPKLVRSIVYLAPSDPTVKVRSWKMNEFKYYDVPSPFPTLARGLFSTELDSDEEESERQPRYRIVARGYDKFFNIGEVPWTDWSSLEAHTGPKYTLSVKSNGCIIFIAAISSSKLIVTSKHALGQLDGVLETHSQAGHRWLKSNLTSKEKTEEQLAAALWENNWTAIAELCDDQFEEHVLPYPPDKSGLYLHGINKTCKEFYTLPTHVVDEFAEKWGFWKTATVEYNTIAEVKAFTDDISRTGKWQGEPLEGFVVRTTVVDPKSGTTDRERRPPYPSGCSFFFKVKFDEPYMMYRDWREITKILLSAQGSLHEAQLPKSRMKRKETKAYVKWVNNEIKTNLAAFEGFLQGKGIISTRDRFLSWLGTEQGKTSLSEVEKSDRATKEFGKTIILPVAIPGCGKTSVAIALVHLFGIAHTQSDDVQGKKAGPAFIKNVVNLLKQHDVVIADKNNHQRQHRQVLREAVEHIEPPVRLLALNWALNKPHATLLRVCGDRIFDRGDKHQTLRADPAGKLHENVVWRFIQETEELAESEIDATIEMDIDDSFEAAVGRAADGCADILSLQRPDQKQLEEAVRVARSYAAAAKKRANKEKEKVKASTDPRYYGILVEVNIEAIVGPLMEQAEDVAYDGKAFWHKLVSEARIAQRPHITIVHKMCLPGEADLWERCAALDRLPAPPLFSFALGHLVWNERIMALTVDDFELANKSTQDDPEQKRNEFVSKLPADVRDRLHITVGTANGSVPPYEAKDLVDAWRKGQQTRIGSLDLEELSAKGRIKGLHS